MTAYRKLTEVDIREMLSAQHVGPEIIERVVRMNPGAIEGDLLRGIHYKRRDDPQWWIDCIGKGAFLRRFGRVAFDTLDPRAILKRGRRVYIRYAYVPRGAA